jgi:uncharacterized Fe-S cluster protein YjdI
MNQERVNEYSNGEITIAWKSELCIHAAKCVSTLPQVYKPEEKPWIKIENASSDELKEQINKCPSGALTFTLNSQKNNYESHRKNYQNFAGPYGSSIWIEFISTFYTNASSNG